MWEFARYTVAAAHGIIFPANTLGRIAMFRHNIDVRVCAPVCPLFGIFGVSFFVCFLVCFSELFLFRLARIVESLAVHTLGRVAVFRHDDFSFVCACVYASGFFFLLYDFTSLPCVFPRPTHTPFACRIASGGRFPQPSLLPALRDVGRLGHHPRLRDSK